MSFETKTHRNLWDFLIPHFLSAVPARLWDAAGPRKAVTGALSAGGQWACRTHSALGPAEPLKAKGCFLTHLPHAHVQSPTCPSAHRTALTHVHITYPQVHTLGAPCPALPGTRQPTHLHLSSPALTHIHPGTSTPVHPCPLSCRVHSYTHTHTHTDSWLHC